jgi:hypothetical protein
MGEKYPFVSTRPANVAWKYCCTQIRCPGPQKESLFSSQICKKQIVWFLQKRDYCLTQSQEMLHMINCHNSCIRWGLHTISFSTLACLLVSPVFRPCLGSWQDFLSVTLRKLLGDESPIAKFLFFSLKSLPTFSALRLEPKCRSFAVDVSVGAE